LEKNYLINDHVYLYYVINLNYNNDSNKDNNNIIINEYYNENIIHAFYTINMN